MHSLHEMEDYPVNYLGARMASCKSICDETKCVMFSSDNALLFFVGEVCERF